MTENSNSLKYMELAFNVVEVGLKPAHCCVTTFNGFDLKIGTYAITSMIFKFHMAHSSTSNYFYELFILKLKISDNLTQSWRFDD